MESPSDRPRAGHLQVPDMEHLIPERRMRHLFVVGSTLIAGAILLQPTPARAQAPAAPTITVSADATLQVPADSVTFTLSWLLGAAPGDAQQPEDDKTITDLKALLHDAGAGAVPIRFSATPSWMSYNSDDDNAERAQRTRRVEVTLTGRSVITAVLTRLRNHPVLRVDDSDFDCTCREAMQHQASAMAFAKARGRAEALATAAGGHLHGLRMVTNQPFGMYMGYQEGRVSASYANAGNAPQPPSRITSQPSGDGLQIPLLNVREMVYTVWELGE
jgi:uncharacterized protein YggE